ncbi:hypothetical protein [Endothiovibrio diazotrophicus]
MTQRHLPLPLLLCAASLPLGAAAAGHEHDHDHAAPTHFPALTGHLDVVQHLDRVIDADDADAEIDEAYLHAHLGLALHFNPRLTLNGSLKIEGHPAGAHHHDHGHAEEEGEEDHEDHDEPLTTGDRWWEEHEGRVEQLNLRYQGDDFHLLAGKFNPVVGLDGHDAPGLWGYQIFESYEISGRVGLGGGIAFDAGDRGRHRLEASLFRADTSFLSNTWITREASLDAEDGGVANTDGLDSWALSLSGNGFYSYDLGSAWVEGLSYRAGLARQAAGVDGEKDEQRWSIALQQRFSGGGWGGRLIAEHMAIDHLGGEAAHDRDHTTLGLELERGRWILGGTYTYVDNRAAEADESVDGHVGQLSVGYRLRRGVTLESGLMDDDRDGESRTRIGLAVRIDSHF